MLKIIRILILLPLILGLIAGKPAFWSGRAPPEPSAGPWWMLNGGEVAGADVQIINSFDRRAWFGA